MAPKPTTSSMPTAASTGSRSLPRRVAEVSKERNDRLTTTQERDHQRDRPDLEQTQHEQHRPAGVGASSRRIITAPPKLMISQAIRSPRHRATEHAERAD